MKHLVLYVFLVFGLRFLEGGDAGVVGEDGSFLLPLRNHYLGTGVTVSVMINTGRNEEGPPDPVVLLQASASAFRERKR